MLVNKLQHTIFTPILPESLRDFWVVLSFKEKIYNGNILTYSFINDNKWKVSIFGCYAIFLNNQ
jgi:hypothetical protein